MKLVVEPELESTVTVIVIAFNSESWIRSCLNSIPGASQQHDFRVIVVDNASDDGSADIVAEEFPEVELIRSSKNLGFARAVNLAAQSVTTDFILLLNPDGYLEPRSLDRLINFAKSHVQYTVCGGRTLTPERTLDPRSCWAAPTFWSIFANSFLLSYLFSKRRFFSPEKMLEFDRDHVREVDIVTGCLLLIRSADWAALGGFDERFFVYGEDTDLCLRAGARGLRCAVTPEATMVHAGGGSADSTPHHHELVLAGRITLLLTHWHPLKARAGQAVIVFGVVLRALIGSISGRREVGTLWREVWGRRSSWWRGYQVTPQNDHVEIAS